MYRLRIAHLQELGHKVILVPMDRTFASLTDAEQQETIRRIEAGAAKSAVDGTVVVAWQEGSGHCVIGAQALLPYLNTLTWPQIMASLNAEISVA